MSVPRSTPQPIRLLLVDDNEVFLLGLQTLFSRVPSIRMVGTASTAATALSEARRLTPDVVLMDLRLPDGTGVESCREIRAICPGTRVLFLTSYQEEKGAPVTLSPQQKRVLALLAEGKTNKEIARALELADKTVTNYVRHIFQKIHVSRRSQATAYYFRHSLDRVKLL